MKGLWTRWDLPISNTRRSPPTKEEVEANREADRRLMYVAATRAKERLILTVPLSRPDPFKPVWVQPDSAAV